VAAIADRNELLFLTERTFGNFDSASFGIKVEKLATLTTSNDYSILEVLRRRVCKFGNMISPKP